MQMDEISQEIGIDLQTESLLVRAEQLARLETDKLVDKVKGTIDITFFRCRCHVANVSSVLCFFVANRVLTTRAVFVLQLHDPTEDSARAIVPRAPLSQRSKPAARAKRLREASQPPQTSSSVDVHFVADSPILREVSLK